MSAYHLAQLNIGIARGPIDSPIMAEFVAALDPINRLADQSPGFVWRLQTEEGNATAVAWPGEENVIINMSVWESIDSLSNFVYRSVHTDVMRQRRKWFEAMNLYMVLWWIKRGHVPTVDEAHERLRHLGEHGPTAFAFTFRRPFPAPDATRSVTPRADDRCPGP
jgi:Domain of unknown function (DUF3291)